MARISKQQQAENKQKLDAYIWEVFKTEGWEAVTYTRLADFMGTRKSTIQGYYPKSSDFLDGLTGKLFPEIRPLLDMSSKDAFIESLCECLKTHKVFRENFALVIGDAVSNQGGKYASNVAVIFRQRLAQAFQLDEKEAESFFRLVIGHVLAEMIYQYRE